MKFSAAITTLALIAVTGTTQAEGIRGPDVEAGDRALQSIKKRTQFDRWNGACRTESGGHGEYSQYSGQDYDWCHDACLRLSSCEAFEYSYDPNTGKKNCEIHSKVPRGFEPKSIRTTCFVKYHRIGI